MAKETQRTLEECRRRGWTPGVVERWKPGMRGKKGEKPSMTAYGTRVDVFGFGDVLVMDDDDLPGSLMIQSTSKSGVSTRMKKLLRGDPKVRANVEKWLRKRNRLAVWGWYKAERRVNGRLWVFEERWITLSHPDLLAPPLVVS